MRSAHVRGLIEKWRGEATTLRTRYLDERLAAVLSRLADELNDALEQDESEPLTLEQAAHESGYSAEHLGRMVRDHKVPNAGRHHAPRIRRRDLPLKATTLRDEPHSRDIASDRTAIARSIATQIR